MNHPLLIVQHAGYGETPPCEAAQFKPGDVVNVRKRRHLAGFPSELVVLRAVPPGFPGEYAVADLLGEPRPLMISAPRRVVSYILCRDGDTTPYGVAERDLLPSGKPSIEIGTVSREPEAAE